MGDTHRGSIVACCFPVKDVVVVLQHRTPRTAERVACRATAAQGAHD